jgi:O-antigen/teichoic acid export membrane protein
MDPVWTLSLVIVCVLGVESFLPIPKNYFRAKDESGRFAMLNFVQGILTVTLITLTLVFASQKKVEGILWARAGAVALALGLAAGMTYKSLIGSYTLSRVKTLFRFALPLIPTTVALLILDSSDRFFLTYFHNLEEVGIYGLGYKLGMGLLIPFSVTQLALPQRLMAWNREENLRPQGIKFTNIYICIIGGMALLVILFAQDIVRLVAPAEFMRASFVIGPVVLGSVAFGSYSLLTSGVYVTGSTHPLMVVTGSAAIINICLNFWTVPRWGAVGAAWSTLAAYAWMAFFVYWRVARKTPLKIQPLNIVKWILPVLTLTILIALEPSLFATTHWKVVLIGIYLLGASLQIMHYVQKPE